LDDPLTTLCVAGMALALGAIFFFSLAEASLLAFSEVSLRRLVDKGDKRGRAIEKLKSNDGYLSAIIVGMNASVILVSTLMTVLVSRRTGEGHGDGWVGEAWHVGTIVFILVVAELTPKTWGTLMAERTAPLLAPAVQRIVVITAPAIWLFSAISSLVLRSSGSPLAHTRHFITAGEIQAAADISEEEGIVEPQEGEMLDSVLELGDTTAREIMVPRVDIVAVPNTATTGQAVAVAVESGFSRIPVYDRTVDSITGILYVTDLLRALRTGQPSADLQALAREAYFIPETKRVGELFRELRDQSIHIAIVLDESGGTEGLVTIEDILEELVGEIEDEHDVPEHGIELISETEALVDGKVRIAEVNERLQCELPEDEHETIAGLVAGRMERIPEVGERLEEGGVHLVVEKGTPQRVEQVRVTKPNGRGSES